MSETGQEFQGILAEIAAAEKELVKLQEKNANQSPSVAPSVLVLKDGIKVLENARLEGLSEDNGMRYYLAVGELEEQVKSLRNLKECSERLNQDKENEFNKLKLEMEEQRMLNAKMEEEITQLKSQTTNTDCSARDIEKEKTKALKRTNKLVLRKIKDEFRRFLEDVSRKENSSDDIDVTSNTGLLLQTLWSQFQKDCDAWVDIDGIPHDVPDPILNKLVENGVVLKNSDDANQIKLENFTMFN